jgi:hypothetical protein
MNELDKITKKNFRAGIIHCIKGGLTSHAMLGSSGETYIMNGSKSSDVSRISQVSLRLYNKDVELLLTDTKGDFLFCGRYHLSHGIDFLTNEYYRIFKANLEWIKTVAPNRNSVDLTDYTKFKKAFIVIPHWSDIQSPERYKQGDSPTYAETASKAKYEYYLHLEMDDNDWFKYRALRWPEMDLFPPVLHDNIKDMEITEKELKKMIHTYASDSDSPGYRNYYNGPIDDKEFKRLLMLDLAVRNTSRDNSLTKGTTYFHLTELGIKVVMSTREVKRSDM